MTLASFRRLIALGAALVLVLTGGAYFTLRSPSAPEAPPETPVALISVSSEPPLLGARSRAPAEVEEYRKFQAALVKSEFVVNAALRDPHLRELDVLRLHRGNALAWLTERLKVEYRGSTSVLCIEVTGVAPSDSAILANAVARAYISEAAEQDVRRAREAHRRLEDARDALKQKATARREALRQSATALGVPPDRADQRVLLAALYSERTNLRTELIRVRTGAGNGADREKVIRNELTELETRIKACEHADLEAARTEVASLDAALAALGHELVRSELEMSAPARVSLLAPAKTPEK